MLQINGGCHSHVSLVIFAVGARKAYFTPSLLTFISFVFLSTHKRIRWDMITRVDALIKFRCGNPSQIVIQIPESAEDNLLVRWCNGTSLLQTLNVISRRNVSISATDKREAILLLQTQLHCNNEFRYLNSDFKVQYLKKHLAVKIQTNNFQNCLQFQGAWDLYN